MTRRRNKDRLRLKGRSLRKVISLTRRAEAAIRNNRLEEATRTIRALEKASGHTSAGAYYYAGWLCYRVLRDYAKAEALFLEAIRLGHRAATAWHNVGCVRREQGKLAAAAAAFADALAINPDLHDSLIALGNTLIELGDDAAAEVCYERAMAVEPATADGRYSRSLLDLSRGNLERAWRDYEARWQCDFFLMEHNRTYAAPMWDGGPVARLMVTAEQGMGDAIQMLRYVPLLADRCEQLVLEVHAPLLRWIRATWPDLDVRELGAVETGYDAWVGTMSLPLWCGTRAGGDIPACPYLAPPAARLDGDYRTGHLRVGMVWAGGVLTRHDWRRSVPLDVFAPLFGVPGIAPVSMMVERAEGLEAYPQVAPMAPVADFHDTAALLCHNLDLLITVDTASAHAAGALGVPVWMLTPALPDARWQRHRSDTPWYPSMTLYRQDVPNDWRGVVARIVDDLALLASIRRAA